MRSRAILDCPQFIFLETQTYAPARAAVEASEIMARALSSGAPSSALPLDAEYDDAECIATGLASDEEPPKTGQLNQPKRLFSQLERHEVTVRGLGLLEPVLLLGLLPGAVLLPAVLF